MHKDISGGPCSKIGSACTHPEKSWTKQWLADAQAASGKRTRARITPLDLPIQCIFVQLDIIIVIWPRLPLISLVIGLLIRKAVRDGGNAV